MTIRENFFDKYKNKIFCNEYRARKQKRENEFNYCGISEQTGTLLY